MASLPRFLKKYLFAAFSSLYLFTVGFWSARHRVLLSQICEHFGLGKPKARIPKIGNWDLLKGPTSVTLCELGEWDGNVAINELAIISFLVSKNNPKKVFEIGTFDGRTTLNIANNCPREAKVFTLDLPKKDLDVTGLKIEDGDKKFVNKDHIGHRSLSAENSKITQLYGDSATFDWAPYNNAIDFLFIDGSHSYDYVMKDSLTALKIVKDQGLILWHDYDNRFWPGLTTALNELYSTRPEFKGLRHIEGTSIVFLQHTRK